jgi:hypothetical protein
LYFVEQVSWDVIHILIYLVEEQDGWSAWFSKGFVPPPALTLLRASGVPGVGLVMPESAAAARELKEERQDWRLATEPLQMGE